MANLISPEIVELGKNAPWFLVSVVLVIGIVKFSKWAGSKINDIYELLFNKETGKLLEVLNSQTAFINSVKVSNDQIKTEITNAMASIKEIEQRLNHLGRTGFENMNSEYFRVLFEESPVPICFIDADGKFVTSNQKACEMLGYSSEELQNLTFIDVTALKDLETDKRKSESLKYGELDHYRIEKTYIRKDGEAVYCALHVYRIPSEGSFNHYVTVMLPLRGEFVVR